MNMRALIQHYRGPLLFLLKFAGVYVLGNLVYGLYIHSYYPLVDPITSFISSNTVSLLNFLEYDVTPVPDAHAPYVALLVGERTTISVFEGCNGVNVFIIYLAFILAFSGKRKDFYTFFFIGAITIHIANLARILLLFFVSENLQDYFYFMHKFVFTGVIYIVVFYMWYLWVRTVMRNQ